MAAASSGGKARGAGAAVAILAAAGLGTMIGLPTRRTSEPSLPGPGAPGSDSKGKSSNKSNPTPAVPGSKPGGAWKPPEGNPVERLLQAKSAAERVELIGAFVAVGHDRNANMLRQALYDPAVEVRQAAVESITSLTDEEAAKVLPHAVANDDSKIRAQGWDILSRHPAEEQNAAYRYVMAEGSDAALAEAFSEMFQNPQRAVFEGMLDMGSKLPAARQQGVLQEIQKWLTEPSGSEDVPAFRSIPEAQAWWKTHQQKFDDGMLRID